MTTGLHCNVIVLTGIGLIVSGGFAVVQPDSRLSVNAVEAYPLEDFSAEVSFSLYARAVLNFFFTDDIPGYPQPDC